MCDVPVSCAHSRIRYIRYPALNGGWYISPQCLDCRELVKLPQHYGRYLIKRFEVPAGYRIVTVESANG